MSDLKRNGGRPTLCGEVLVQVALRLPRTLLARLDAEEASMAAQEAWARPTRSAVVRKLLAEALTARAVAAKVPA